MRYPVEQPGNVVSGGRNLLCTLTPLFFSSLEGLGWLILPGRNAAVKELDDCGCSKSFMSVICCYFANQPSEDGYSLLSKTSAFVGFSKPKSGTTLSYCTFSFRRSSCFLSFCFSFRGSFYETTLVSGVHIVKPRVDIALTIAASNSSMPPLVLPGVSGKP